MAIFNLIATPRNLSTALMYSFAQRRDTTVVDEPFYAFYLDRTDADHPGKEDVLNSMERNPAQVLINLVEYKTDRPHLFIKNMAHHIDTLSTSYWINMHHVFLVRDPMRLITSYAKVIPQPDMSNIGLDIQRRLHELFTHLELKTAILDSDALLNDPKDALERLCYSLEIPFDPAMLSWEAGPIVEDGIWAKYWYKNVHKSTGFRKQKSSSDPLPEHCRPLYEECLPHYQYFLEKMTNH